MQTSSITITLLGMPEYEAMLMKLQNSRLQMHIPSVIINQLHKKDHTDKSLYSAINFSSDYKIHFSFRWYQHLHCEFTPLKGNNSNDGYNRIPRFMIWYNILENHVWPRTLLTTLLTSLKQYCRKWRSPIKDSEIYSLITFVKFLIDFFIFLER